ACSAARAATPTCATIRATKAGSPPTRCDATIAWMFGYQAIREVHLEITSRCNAACPQCGRNDSLGRDNPELPLTELSLDDVKALFPAELVARLQHLYMCGNYGDALVARDTLEVFAWLRALNPELRLSMLTNGSGRTGGWWRELARLGVTVHFGIDGLEDTNHLYRRNTSWPRILESVRAFIGGGGRALWDYIVFRHNEHQIEEAR